MVKTNNSAPAPMPSGLDGHMPVEIIHMDAKKTPEQNDAKEAEKKETKEETKEEQRTFFDQVRDEVETSGDSDIRLASARYPEVISTEEADKLAELRGKKETFTEKDHAQQIEQLAQLEAELTLLIRMSGMIDERYSEQIPDPSSRSKIVILASNKLIENNKDTKVAEQFRQAIDESEDDNIDSTTALRKAQEQIKSLSSFLESGTKPLDTFLEENKADKQLDEILEKPDNIVRIFAGDSLQEIV